MPPVASAEAVTSVDSFVHSGGAISAGTPAIAGDSSVSPVASKVRALIGADKANAAMVSNANDYDMTPSPVHSKHNRTSRRVANSAEEFCQLPDTSSKFSELSRT